MDFSGIFTLNFCAVKYAGVEALDTQKQYFLRKDYQGSSSFISLLFFFFLYLSDESLINNILSF